MSSPSPLQPATDLPAGAPPRRRGQLLLGGSVAVLVLLVAGGGLLLANQPSGPTPEPSASAPAIGGPSVEQTLPPSPPSSPPIEPTAAPTAAPTAPPTPTPSATPSGPTSLPPEKLTGFVWPLRNARLSSPFGQRDDGLVVVNGERYHDGIDLASWCGDRIRAAHDGVVLYAGRKFDEHTGFSDSLDAFYARLDRIGGLSLLPITVVIDYGNGYRGLYAHLARASVKEGDVVEAGQVIGLEGATGRATGCHLHYSIVRMDGAWIAIAPNLAESLRYPPFVRERVDPLLVLPIPDIYAPRKFQPRTTPAPKPIPAEPGFGGAIEP